jgi:signal transduction histidine kinase
MSGARLWPRSLYGQILLVAASALLVAQAVNATLLLTGAKSRAVLETSTMIISRVANQIERQDSLGMRVGQFDPLERTNVVRPDQKRRRPPPVAIATDTKPLVIDGLEYQSEISERAKEFLRQGELDIAKVRISTLPVSLLPAELRDPQMKRWRKARLSGKDRPIPQDAVLFTARLPDGRWIKAAGFVRPTETASIIALLFQTLFLFIAVMVPLAIVARRIARPLLQLTERVQRVGLTDEIAPMASEGPEDVKLLIESFNVMQARVSSLLGEKDVMLGAIGHDLKTPLAALRVRVESVEDDIERDKMAATIDEMVTILDDILMLARLGKSGEALQSVDIGALTESITEEFPAATFVEPQSRVVAQVRPVLLRRALRNLIGNAVTYGNTAAVSVHQRHGNTFVEICDAGPGIPLELMDGLFEPFARADASRNRTTGGSGLGLTIARAIARSHDGNVILENQSDGGLRATISFKG